MSLAESLMHMYLKRDKYLVKMFESIFKYQTYLCYISPEWQEKFIIRLCKKKKLGSDLQKIVKYLKKNNIPLDDALYLYFNSRNARNNKLSGFYDLGFSPIPISDHEISYLLPLDKALGFSTVYENDKCYMKISQSKGRKKEMFTYEPGEE